MPLIGAPLAQVLGLRDVDRRTFDYFISHTAPRLAGAWDKVRASSVLTGLRCIMLRPI